MVCTELSGCSATTFSLLITLLPSIDIRKVVVLCVPISQSHSRCLFRAMKPLTRVIRPVPCRNAALCSEEEKDIASHRDGRRVVIPSMPEFKGNEQGSQVQQGSCPQ